MDLLVLRSTCSAALCRRARRCANNQGADGKWNKFGGRLAWDSTAICSNNPAFGGRGNPKQGDDYAAAPNVDHSQEKIRKVGPLARSWVAGRPSCYLYLGSCTHYLCSCYGVAGGRQHDGATCLRKGTGRPGQSCSQ